MTSFSWPIRVYYEDTDCGGVVYHANYLKFMERARTEWLRRLGCEQDRLREQTGLLFAVRAIVIDYHRPARFNDHLRVTVDIAAIRPASLLFEQRIFSVDEPSDTPLCAAQVRVACIDGHTLRPRALPRTLLTEIERGH